MAASTPAQCLPTYSSHILHGLGTLRSRALNPDDTWAHLGSCEDRGLGPALDTAVLKAPDIVYVQLKLRIVLGLSSPQSLEALLYSQYTECVLIGHHCIT